MFLQVEVKVGVVVYESLGEMLEFETHCHSVNVKVWMSATHECAETDVGVRFLALGYEQGRG